MARPKASPETTKPDKVTARLSSLLGQAFRDGAVMRNMTPSEYLRYLVANSPQGPQSDQDAIK